MPTIPRPEVLVIVSVPEKVTKVLVGTELVNMELVVRPSNN
jgi:hypothetical protein